MSDKMREEFEDWCDLNGFASDRYELSDLGEAYKHLCGEYVIRESRLMWQAWQASRSAMMSEGWQLVPVEPTKEMEEQGGISYWSGETNSESILEVWNAMLGAAPKP